MAKKSGKAAVAGEPVRMLVDRVVDGVQYLVNQVVVFPEHLKAELVKTGAVDAAKEAVEYCVAELAADVIEHIVDAVEDAIGGEEQQAEQGE